MSRKRTGRTVWDVLTDLGGWGLALAFGLVGWLTVQTGTLLGSLLLLVALPLVPLGLLRWGRQIGELVERLWRGTNVLPRGWDGELFAVYAWRWPAAEWLRVVAPDLPEWYGGRLSYIGLDGSGLVERRAATHARERREFVLPYATRTAYFVPSRQAMVELERRMIREADAGGEPIVNRVRYRTGT